MAKCIVCDKWIVTSVSDVDTWITPAEAVVFRGVGNYGSTLYDPVIDDRNAMVIICDDCLKNKKDCVKITVEGHADV